MVFRKLHAFTVFMSVFRGKGRVSRATQERRM